jgi:hypothetical protein
MNSYWTESLMAVEAFNNINVNAIGFKRYTPSGFNTSYDHGTNSLAPNCRRCGVVHRYLLTYDLTVAGDRSEVASFLKLDTDRFVDRALGTQARRGLLCRSSDVVDTAKHDTVTIYKHSWLVYPDKSFELAHTEYNDGTGGPLFYSLPTPLSRPVITLPDHYRYGLLAWPSWGPLSGD